MTNNPNSRPYRRRADQTMDVLAANIPLLLLADLAGEGAQPVAEAATETPELDAPESGQQADQGTA